MISNKFAKFTQELRFEDLPDEVILRLKRSF
jgi:hypothetical protein